MKQRQHTDIYKKTRKQLEQENCACRPWQNWMD